MIKPPSVLPPPNSQLKTPSTTSSELDIYEFSEDAVLLETPKLKMFSPARSPDKKDDSPKGSEPQSGDEGKHTDALLKCSADKLEPFSETTLVKGKCKGGSIVETPTGTKIVIPSTLSVAKGETEPVSTPTPVHPPRSISPAITDLGMGSKKLAAVKSRNTTPATPKAIVAVVPHIVPASVVAPKLPILLTPELVSNLPPVVQRPVVISVPAVQIQSPVLSTIESSEVQKSIPNTTDSDKEAKKSETNSDLKNTLEKSPAKTTRRKKQNVSSSEKKKSIRKVKNSKAFMESSDSEMEKEHEVKALKKLKDVKRKDVKIGKKFEEAVPTVSKVLTSDISSAPSSEAGLDPKTGKWTLYSAAEEDSPIVGKSEMFVELDLDLTPKKTSTPKGKKMSPVSAKGTKRKYTASPAKSKKPKPKIHVEESKLRSESQKDDSHAQSITPTTTDTTLKLNYMDENKLEIILDTSGLSEDKKLTDMDSVSTIVLDSSSAPVKDEVNVEPALKTDSRRNSISSKDKDTEDEIAELKCEESLDDKEDIDEHMNEISSKKSETDSTLATTSEKVESQLETGPEEELEPKKEEPLSASMNEEESCSSLLCEEIIPGSPTSGTDLDQFDAHGHHNEDAMMSEELSGKQDKLKDGESKGEGKVVLDVGAEGMGGAVASSSKPLTFEGSIKKDDVIKGPELPPPSSIPSFSAAHFPHGDNTPPMTPESSSISSSGESPRG